jgi:hypothetical protein
MTRLCRCWVNGRFIIWPLKGQKIVKSRQLIVLGGAFQNFTSYRFFVADVLEILP